MTTFVPTPDLGRQGPATSWLHQLPADPADAARLYARHGWPVVLLWPANPDGSCGCAKGAACPRPGKHPLARDWQHPLSADELETRLARHKSFNLGLLTGLAFWVLDLDGANGLAQLEQLEAAHGPLPPTLTVATGGGGLHPYFLLPEGWQLGNRVRVLPGVDVRAVGGLVVAPPSVHASGHPYTLSTVAPLAQAPDWLLHLVGAPLASRAPAQPAPPGQPAQGPAPQSAAKRRPLAAQPPGAELPPLERARRYLAKMEPAVAGQGGDQQTYRAACLLVLDYGLADAEALSLLHEWNTRCQPPWSEADLRAKLRHARRYGRGEAGRLANEKPLRLVAPQPTSQAPAKPTASTPRAPAQPSPEASPPKRDRAQAPSPPARPRPVIVVRHEEYDVNSEAIAALAHEPSVFQRLGQLVYVATDASKLAGVVRPPGEPCILPLPLPKLRELLGRSAAWQREVMSRQGPTYEPAHPPAWCVQAVAARGEWPELRPLDGVIEAPILRPDGSALTSPGYDDATGLLNIATTPVPPLPARPTLDDARRALAELLDLVGDFPFETAAHRAAWLAALLTPFALYAAGGPPPLFLLDANTRGAGKTTLVKIIWALAFGRPLQPFPHAPDPEEERKRLMAIALSGLSAVCIDNIAAPLGSPSLDMVLTSQAISDRLLGQNTLRTVPLVAAWYATGNNVALQGDLARRTCHVRLASPEENPEERRDFKHPALLAYVRRERARLLVACLTVLRAYVEAGRPAQGLKPWGGFQEWSDLIRNALVWAGQPDPGETREGVNAMQDQERSGLAGLLAAWEAAAPNGRGLTVADVLRWLSPQESLTADPSAPPREVCQRLRDALLELCPGRDGKLPTPKSLGMKLQQIRGRVVGRRALDCRRNRLNTAEWFVRGPNRPAGTAGTAGT